MVSKLLCCFLILTLMMVDQTDGLWRRRRRRRRRSCSARSCVMDSWSWWSSCSQSCGRGTRSRSRTMLSQATCGGSCSYDFYDSTSCYVRSCPVHGGFSSWSSWTSCDKTCGTGSQERYRSCTNRAPRYGGYYCSGSRRDKRLCNKQPCPVHGGWNPWGSWTACGKTCGGGVRERTRFCTNPPPYHGGKGCGSHYYESKECAANKCPVHGGWSNWSNWTECSVTCGAGVRTRERNCDNPVPAYGGTLCEGIYKDKKSCSTGEICVAEVGCYKSFASDRLGNFIDEIQWSGHFSSQMQRIVKKCAHLAVKKRKRFFAVEDFGNCYGAQNFPSGSESKATRCIFGVGVKSHYFVYEAL